MKLLAILPFALIYGNYCAASENTQRRNAESPELAARDGSSTCSLGIGREISSVNTWDVTVYNVPQPQRQDTNIIATVRNAHMDKGESLTVNGPQDITITNVDNAPAISYDDPDLVAPLNNPNTNTKVRLEFQIEGTNTKWTTDNCTAQSVVWSAGRESWECEFPCTISTPKEL